DSVDYSCGYDTVFTVLANVWSEKSDVWGRRFKSYSSLLFQLSASLLEWRTGALTLEGCRDRMRSRMYRLKPADFPYGARGTSMDLVSLALVPKDSYAVKKAVCDRCGYVDPSEVPVFDPFMCAGLSRIQLEENPRGIPISLWMSSHLARGRSLCPACELEGLRAVKMRMCVEIVRLPNVLFISVEHENLVFDAALSFDCRGVRRTLKLRGIVYGGGGHFTCRFVSNSGTVWYHDGITTGRRCIEEGRLEDIVPADLMRTRNKLAVLLIYAKL
ncbi:hypothetical protein DFH06DRAFT_959883, partial [Mycena polygramma]